MKIFNLNNLEDKLLVSPIRYDKSNFDYQAVIYICIQTDKNYIGFYINKTLGEININSQSEYRKLNVHFGGTNSMNSYFILHSPKYYSNQTVKINNHISLTKQVDIVGDVINNLVDDFIILTGYSSWTHEEINSKIKDENWICTESNSNIIFFDDDSMKWQNAVSLSSETQLDNYSYKQITNLNQ